jgi:hypothetical protein
MILLREEVAQNNGYFWATFCLSKFIKFSPFLFQSMVYFRYFKVSKVVCCRCFGLSN